MVKGMITTTAVDLMSGAIFSEDGKYRYALWRFWNYSAAVAGTARATMFIMGNASKAGRFNDDPTTIKVCHYAQRWGYDGVYIGNLYAVADTHWAGEDTEGKIGPECDKWLMTMRNSSRKHVAAWGFVGGFNEERTRAVIRMFPTLYHLGLSMKGIPKHPLYLSPWQEPVEWGELPSPQFKG